MKPTSVHVQAALGGGDGLHYRTKGVYVWAAHMGGVTCIYVGSSTNPKLRLSQHATVRPPKIPAAHFLQEFILETPPYEQTANFEFAVMHSHLFGRKLHRFENNIAKMFADKTAHRIDVRILNDKIGDVPQDFLPDESTSRKITPSIWDFIGDKDE